MPPRSSVRTNVIIFTILGFVVALLIHFIVLSSGEYNWLQDPVQGLTQNLSLAFSYLSTLL